MCANYSLMFRSSDNGVSRHKPTGYVRFTLWVMKAISLLDVDDCVRETYSDRSDPPGT